MIKAKDYKIDSIYDESKICDVLRHLRNNIKWNLPNYITTKDGEILVHFYIASISSLGRNFNNKLIKYTKLPVYYYKQRSLIMYYKNLNLRLLSKFDYDINHIGIYNRPLYLASKKQKKLH